MPLEKKTRHLVALPAVSEAVAARLLVAYHLAHQRPMMGRFLDALGIAHEDGLIADETVTPPPQDRLAPPPRRSRPPIPPRTSRCISRRCSGRTRRRGAASADLSEVRAAS